MNFKKEHPKELPKYIYFCMKNLRQNINNNINFATYNLDCPNIIVRTIISQLLEISIQDNDSSRN